MPPDENEEEQLEKLSGDVSPPFGPPEDADDAAENHSTRPETDSNIDMTEFYQVGIDGAAGIEEPNEDDTVIGYRPRKDPGQSGTTPDDTQPEEDLRAHDSE